ncbi:hypothetical protein X748_29805 [Mesorhizobium sp. LNJC386A00]|nr:hypothetical protein X748_29805 [Mesorhizobium sp. LNJC386A00]
MVMVMVMIMIMAAGHSFVLQTPGSARATGPGR